MRMRELPPLLTRIPARQEQESLIEIYRRLRPGDPPTVDSAETLLKNLFFDPRRYDISTAGRYKFNKKLAQSGTEYAGHQARQGLSFLRLLAKYWRRRGEVLTRDESRGALDKKGIH